MTATRYTTVSIMGDETSSFVGEDRERAEKSARRYLEKLPAGTHAVIRVEDVDPFTDRITLIDFWGFRL